MRHRKLSDALTHFHLKESLLGIIAVAILLVAINRPIFAAETLTFAAAAGTVDTVISEVILRKAYNKLGIGIAIKEYPGERALKLANAGRVAGDVQRIDGLGEKYQNLIQVRPAINFIEGAVFSKTARITVSGWDSLKPHRIGLIRGIKFAEINTKGMKTEKVPDYENLFRMLQKGRVDIAISPRLNGHYQLKRLGITGIHELLPPVQKFQLFHYLHKKNVNLVPKLSQVLSAMQNSGELDRLRNHIVSVILGRAERGLPICDKDYACFETGPGSKK